MHVGYSVDITSVIVIVNSVTNARVYHIKRELLKRFVDIIHTYIFHK